MTSPLDWPPEPDRERIAALHREHLDWERAHAAEYAETLRQRAELQSTLRWRASHGWYWFWWCYWPLVLALVPLVAALIVIGLVGL